LKSEGCEGSPQRQKRTRLFESEGKPGAERTGRGSIRRRNGAWKAGRGSGGAGGERSAVRDGRVPRRPEMWRVWAWVGAGSGPTDARCRPGALDEMPENVLTQQSDGAVVNSAKSATRVDCQIFSALVARAVRGPTAGCTRGNGPAAVGRGRSIPSLGELAMHDSKACCYSFSPSPAVVPRARFENAVRWASVGLMGSKRGVGPETTSSGKAGLGGWARSGLRETGWVAR